MGTLVEAEEIIERDSANAGILKALIWSGPLLVVSIMFGCVIAGFIPPPAPTDSAETIANWYAQNQVIIRVCCMAMMIGFSFYATWGAGLTVWIRRLERGTPRLTYASIALVAIGTVFFELIPLTWVVAAFRPESIDPDTTRMLNDLGWFYFLYSVPPFSVWLWIIAAAILNDKNDPALFPRWFGYMTIWVGLFILPAGAIGFVHTGPFAYNGLFAFWIPFTLFFTWFCMITTFTLRAIKTKDEHAVQTTALAPSQIVI